MRGNDLDRLVHHGPRPVYKMAEFTDDASTVFVALRPMVERQVSGVHTHIDHHRLLPLGNEFSQLLRHGSEAAVEPYHEKRSVTLLFSGLIGTAGLFQFVLRHRQGFLHEYRFVVGKRSYDITRMAVMARTDKKSLGFGHLPPGRGRFC